MANFIEIKDSYNPLTTQGEGKKHINVSHIVHITNWEDKKANKRISTLKTRIKLSDGELLDVKETVEEILELIINAKNHNI